MANPAHGFHVYETLLQSGEIDGSIVIPLISKLLLDITKANDHTIFSKDQINLTPLRAMTEAKHRMKCHRDNIPTELGKNLPEGAERLRLSIYMLFLRGTLDEDDLLRRSLLLKPKSPSSPIITKFDVDD